eukprot:NODE_2066_length_460_cov_865.924574_g1987_i0.p2 GENE.NODE_2066_length_460_cov_865.924574_g1987_i0~~NODE_2066_length_460_cov_865.924574_g1987_i0.p2  ORF type:complete len:70 (-),score=10.12 NODE_2066_length_460_cov_865.924574_g1987_i0:151-360(-)
MPYCNRDRDCYLGDECFQGINDCYYIDTLVDGFYPSYGLPEKPEPTSAPPAAAGTAAVKALGTAAGTLW